MDGFVGEEGLKTGAVGVLGRDGLLEGSSRAFPTPARSGATEDGGAAAGTGSDASDEREGAEREPSVEAGGASVWPEESDVLDNALPSVETVRESSGGGCAAKGEDANCLMGDSAKGVEGLLTGGSGK